MMLQRGDRAPDFDLEDGTGERWKLRDLAGQKVILFFYPADDTPGCTIEACDFRDSLSEFQDAGYVVLGASPQGAESKQRFSSKYTLNFPLLIDADTEVAKAYGAFKDDGAEWDGVPLKIKRSTFLIDEDGNIAQALYGVNARGHVEALKESFVTA